MLGLVALGFLAIAALVIGGCITLSQNLTTRNKTRLDQAGREHDALDLALDGLAEISAGRVPDPVLFADLTLTDARDILKGRKTH